MRTLLTGFGPFATVVNNPSARIVAHFAGTGIPGHTIVTRVLTVSFAEAAEEVRSLLQEGRFDLAVLLGVARRESTIRLERVGRHCEVADPSADTEPHRTTIPLEPLVADLFAAGFPARLSEDAGGYVCDHTYHAALNAIARANMATRCLFIHVPPDDETFDGPADGDRMPLDRQIEAVSRVFAWLSEHTG